MFFRPVSLFCMLFVSALALGQNSGPIISKNLKIPPSTVMPASEAIDKTLRTSSLTYEGKPFHALLDIDQIDHPGGAYKSVVEIFWQSPQMYRLQLTSRDFSQTLVVNGSQSSEADSGDFYPGWLHQFVQALMDPAPRAQGPLLRSGTVTVYEGKIGSGGVGVTMVGGENRPVITTNMLPSCARHEDRPNGITNEMTRASLCFAGPDFRIVSADQFGYGMDFGQHTSFGKKRVATMYSMMFSIFPADEIRLQGKLTTLKPLGKADPTLFAIPTAATPGQPILTKVISTSEGDALLEQAPQMNWPPVAWGTTEGYLMLHVITDTTGRVRSAWRINADNTWLEPYAMEQALKFKFKPLIVNGVAYQMEAPLVLHFKSAIDESMPKFSGDDVAKVAVGCKDTVLPAGLIPAGVAFTALVFVNEDGKYAGMNYPDGVPPAVRKAIFDSVNSCRFRRVARNGVPFHYHVEFQVTAPETPITPGPTTTQGPPSSSTSQ